MLDRMSCYRVLYVRNRFWYLVLWIFWFRVSVLLYFLWLEEGSVFYESLGLGFWDLNIILFFRVEKEAVTWKFSGYICFFVYCVFVFVCIFIFRFVSCGFIFIFVVIDYVKWVGMYKIFWLVVVEFRYLCGKIW